MKKTRQLLAICGIILLLSMYIACLVLAVTGKHEATTLFRAALGATIAVPLVLYGFLMLLKLFPPFVKNEEFDDGSASDGSGEEPAEENAAFPEEDASK